MMHSASRLNYSLKTIHRTSITRGSHVKLPTDMNASLNRPEARSVKFITIIMQNREIY
jgi:hypothetical protein